MKLRKHCFLRLVRLQGHPQLTIKTQTPDTFHMHIALNAVVSTFIGVKLAFRSRGNSNTHVLWRIYTPNRKGRALWDRIAISLLHIYRALRHRVQYGSVTVLHWASHWIRPTSDKFRYTGKPFRNYSYRTRNYVSVGANSLTYIIGREVFFGNEVTSQHTWCGDQLEVRGLLTLG